MARTGQQDQAAALGLSQDLGGLVLALEHAAAYMVAGEGLPLAEYRRRWQERLASAPRGHEYPPSVAAALGLSLDRVERESPAAYGWLSLFAWLAPEVIAKRELLRRARRNC